VRYINNVT